MTARVGVNVDAWSLRELFAAVKLIARVERLKHRQHWNDVAIANATIINSMPMRGEGWRPVTPDEINPYKAAAVVRGTPLKRGDPESREALRAFVDRNNQATRR